MYKSFISLLVGSAFAVFLLSGCMPFQPQQAPCDQYATGCGQKTKINQW